MRIYFGTNRNPDDADNPTDFGEFFSPAGLTDLRFGWADVTGEEFDEYKLTVAPEKLEVESKKAEVGDLSGQVLGSKIVFEEVRKEMMTQKQDCLIFIHGFDNTFKDAISRAAQIKHFYGDRPMSMFLFTWPSDGRMIPYKSYASDRDDARASGVALGRGLQKLAHFLKTASDVDDCGQSVHMFAHSMGNYALRWAVQGIRSSAGESVRRLLDQIFLFAADEDDDAFEFDHKLQTLPDMARRVNIYQHADDKALMISKYTKGNPDRLGASGPRVARMLPDKVTVVDCGPVVSFRKDGDLQGHQYYRCNEIVRRDVLSVLKGIAPQDVKTRRYQPETRRYRLKQD